MPVFHARLAGRRVGAVAVLWLSAALGQPCVRGDLLNVQLNPDGPLVQGINGSLTYAAGTGAFHVQTEATTISGTAIPGGFAFIDQGVETLDFLVDQNGAFVANGAGLSLTGAIDFDGDGTPDVTGDANDPLLTGDVTDFGSQAPGPPTLTFDGFIEVTGGQLTNAVALSAGGSLGALFKIGELSGFILSAEDVTSGILGDFQSDFASSRTKSDTGRLAVPEPGSATLALIAGLLAVCRRRRTIRAS